MKTEWELLNNGDVVGYLKFDKGRFVASKDGKKWWGYDFHNIEIGFSDSSYIRLDSMDNYWEDVIYFEYMREKEDE
jgi:hypothetical protein